MYTPAAIVIGMVYDYFPFMVLPIYNALIKIDHNLLDAAGDLGATPARTFRKIIFPLSVPGVISGITMVFVPSISEFVIADILGGGKVLLIGNIIEQEFNQGNNWHLGSGISIVLMIFIFVSMMIGPPEGEAAPFHIARIVERHDCQNGYRQIEQDEDYPALIAAAVGTLACVGILYMRKRSQSAIMSVNSIPLLNADIVTGIRG